jgi:fatty-acid desaturase
MGSDNKESHERTLIGFQLSKSLSKHYVSFIDVMFGVMVAESFSSFKEELFAPSFTLFVLLLSYFTILTSWLFYHRSVNKLAEKEPIRFGIDVIILFVISSS